MWDDEILRLLLHPIGGWWFVWSTVRIGPEGWLKLLKSGIFPPPPPPFSKQEASAVCRFKVMYSGQWMDFFFFLNFFTSFFPLNSTKCRSSKEVLYWDHPQLFFLACPHIQIKISQFIWRSQIFLHLNQLSQKSRRNFCLKVFRNVLRWWTQKTSNKSWWDWEFYSWFS